MAVPEAQTPRVPAPQAPQQAPQQVTHAPQANPSDIGAMRRLSARSPAKPPSPGIAPPTVNRPVQVMAVARESSGRPPLPGSTPKRQPAPAASAAAPIVENDLPGQVTKEPPIPHDVREALARYHETAGASGGDAALQRTYTSATDMSSSGGVVVFRTRSALRRAHTGESLPMLRAVVGSGIHGSSEYGRNGVPFPDRRSTGRHSSPHQQHGHGHGQQQSQPQTGKMQAAVVKPQHAKQQSQLAPSLVNYFFFFLFFFFFLIFNFFKILSNIFNHPSISN
jgi:hypothetical protein